MKHETHNPQKLNPDQYGGPDGYRLLTVVEAAVFHDPKSRNSEAGRNLFAHLAPEFYSDAACRWCNIGASAPWNFSEALTYRTLAPELVAEPVPTIEPGFDVDTLNAASGDFVESWNYLAAYHHQLMVGKGFWKGETDVLATLTAAGREDLVPVALAAFDGQKIALQTSEASEALEGLRIGNGPDDKVPQFLSSEAEFADVLLRLMDHAHKRGWDVAGALIAKMHMNATRAAMHGKSF